MPPDHASAVVSAPAPIDTSSVPEAAPADLPFAKGPLAAPFVFDVAQTPVPAKPQSVSSGLQFRGSVPPGAVVDGVFVTHEVDYAVFVGGESWVLAQTATGLWLHEGATLARRVRLVAPSVIGLTANADGTRFAFATVPFGLGLGLPGPRPLRSADVLALGKRTKATLYVAEFPSSKLLGSFAIPHPTRIRMNRAGDAVAVASQRDEAVALVQVPSRKVLRFDVDDEVNDAIPLDGHLDEVAYVTDSDDTFVRDMVRGKELYDSVGAHGAGYPTRDQNGVAYDPATDRLFSSGEDNAVWTYEGWRSGSKRASRSADYAGDVDEIVFTPCQRHSVDLRGLRPLQCADGQIYAALDSIAVVRGHANGARVGPFGDRTFSDPARVFVGAEGAVAMALDGRLARWDGDGGTMFVAPDTLMNAALFAHRGERGTYLTFQNGVFVARGPDRAEATLEPMALTKHSASGLRAVLTIAGVDVLLSAGEGRLTCEFVSASGSVVRAFEHEGRYVEAQKSHDGRVIGVLLSTGELLEISDDGTERARHRLESPMSGPGPYAIPIKRLVASAQGWSVGPRVGAPRPPP